MPLIELIQDNNTTNKSPLRYKGYTDMNPHLLSVNDHQVILEKIEAREILTLMNMWKTINEGSYQCNLYKIMETYLLYYFP